jgi:phosphoglycolate phosphatase-like HAD superfamily hydrolase
MRRRTLLIAAAAVTAASAAFAQADPLPSWNGAARASILAFVLKVTTPGGPDFVSSAERIAVFDNDGTLWSEQPTYFQAAFAFDRIKALAPQHPDWNGREPFKFVLMDDMKGLAATGEKGLLEILAVTHAGITTDEFTRAVEEWMRTARHPRFNRPYTELVYQPMVELLAFLRANQFRTFIVSGGGVEFMRPWTERIYGIPPEQVVGSSGVTKFELRNGKSTLVKEAMVDFIDDGPGKPVGINRFIGRRPIFAFGNSDGDQQMLEYVADGAGPRFIGLLHHTDAEREWAYDRQSHVGRLDKAWDEAVRRGWLVVDMKADWKAVYPFERK